MAQNELLILDDIKGDMCRLGYLKILTQISKEKKRYRINLHTKLFYEYVTKDDSGKGKEAKIYFEKELQDDDRKLSDTGLIRSLKTARSYLEFSHRLKIFNQKKEVFDENGQLYDKLLGPLDENEDMTLILQPSDKIFFLKILFDLDREILRKFMKWAVKECQNPVTRHKTMNHLMEEIYIPTAKEAPKNIKDLRKRQKLRLNLKKWEKYPDTREKYYRDKNPEKWNLHEGYAFYRHNGNPRLEWLVDLGFFEKIETSFKASKDANAISNVFEQESNILHELGKVFYEDASPATDDEIKKQILDSYYKFSNAGFTVVKKSILFSLVCLEFFRENDANDDKKTVKIEDIENVIENMKQESPKSVRYHRDSKGKPIYLVINVRDFN